MVGIINFLILILIGKVQDLILPVALLAVLKPAVWGLLVGLVGHLLFSQPFEPGQRLSRLPTKLWAGFSLGLVLTLFSSLYKGKTLEFLYKKYASTSILLFLVARNLGTLVKVEKSTYGLLATVLCLGIAMVVSPQVQHDPTGGPDRTTVGGTYDANDLAVVLMMTLPIVFYWFWRGGFLLKLLAATAAALALFSLYRTGSRGGLVSLGVVTLYLVFRVKEAGLPLRALLLFGMFAGGAVATQTKTFELLVLGIKGEDYNAVDEDGRLAIWKRGIGYAITNPILGVGAECFEDAEGLLSGRSGAVKGFRWAAAHNSFVQVAAETGLPTFLLWFLMILSAIRELRLQRQQLRPWADDVEVRRVLVLGAMVRCSLYAFLVGGFFLSLGYLPLLYLMVGYSVALANVGDAMLLELEESHHDEDD